MDQESEAPKANLFSKILTPNSEFKALKVKLSKLKGTDEQIYSTVFYLFEKSIIIETSDINDISSRNYLITLSLEDFHNLNPFFKLYSKIEEIFELLEDMQNDEFKITKISSEIIEFFFLIKIRNKINEIKINLKVQKTDINKIINNICEKLKEFNLIKDEIKKLKNEQNLIEEISNLKEKNEKLENSIGEINEKLEISIKKINEKLENKIKDDNKVINELKNENKLLNEKLENKNKEFESYKNSINKINEKLENKIKDDDKVINELKNENKLLNEKLENINKEFENYKNNNKNELNKINERLENKIKDDNKIINELKNENRLLNEKLENKNREFENYKNNNKNNINKNNSDIINIKKDIENNKHAFEKNKNYIKYYNILLNINDKIIYEFSESLNYITNNKILIESNIIKNNFELAQIDNGIKHQLKKNIKKINLLYRCTRDGDDSSYFHSKCDNNSNLLFLIETAENRKFGGFTSLNLQTNGGQKYDDNAFIFSLNNKENYYIIKGKYALYFHDHGINFGQTTNNGSEFHIYDSPSDPCLTKANSYDDTGSSNCYDYGGRSHVLAGKKTFVVKEFETYQISF